MAAEAKNRQLQMVFPELASKYAQYPLQREAWLSLDGTGPESAPAFVGGGNIGMKEHYVYGSGPKEHGYYHVLAREAYSILFKRARSEAPPAGCCTPCFGSQEARDLLDAWDSTKTICYNRSVSSRPNDHIAAQEAHEIARKIANNTYNATQNQQLAIHAILLTT